MKYKPITIGSNQLRRQKGQHRALGGGERITTSNSINRPAKDMYNAHVQGKKWFVYYVLHIACITTWKYDGKAILFWQWRQYIQPLRLLLENDAYDILLMFQSLRDSAGSNSRNEPLHYTDRRSRSIKRILNRQQRSLSFFLWVTGHCYSQNITRLIGGINLLSREMHFDVQPR